MHTPYVHHPERWPHVEEALRPLSAQQRRRLNFIRAERLGPDEIADLPGSFDPGLEYETPAPARRAA